ncbi:MAG TPA: hypothetical protein VNO26_00650 [Candidatus Limnocylindria bacterium]|nr:hypothetical protein [Candidatus Limnocylindria bacterium]
MLSDPIYCTCEWRAVKLYALAGNSRRLMDLFVDPNEPDYGPQAPQEGAATRRPARDGIIDSAEQCDSVNLGGRTCTSIPGGFSGGTLACSASCTWDTSGCTP